MPTTLIEALRDAEQRIGLMLRRHGRYSVQYVHSVNEFQKLVHCAVTHTSQEA